MPKLVIVISLTVAGALLGPAAPGQARCSLVEHAGERAFMDTLTPRLRRLLLHTDDCDRLAGIPTGRPPDELVNVEAVEVNAATAEVRLYVRIGPNTHWEILHLERRSPEGRWGVREMIARPAMAIRGSSGRTPPGAGRAPTEARAIGPTCCSGGVPDRTAASVDPAVAAVQHLVKEHGSPLRVDPRPLKIGTDVPRLPLARDYYPGGQAAARERARLLRGIGVEAAEAIPLRARCDGYLIPPPRDVSGCSDAPDNVLVFDTLVVREGGLGTLSMMEVNYQPEGRSITFFEITLRRKPTGEWVFVRAEPTITFD